jgi:hypothetical protein
MARLHLPLGMMVCGGGGSGAFAPRALVVNFGNVCSIHFSLAKDGEKGQMDDKRYVQYVH